MSQGLNINDIVNVSVNLSPVAAQGRNFGNMMIVGTSNVIDVVQRFRYYTTLSQVGTDFGNNSQEYAAAARFFGQSPTPPSLYIGRWASTATAGILHGGSLTPAQQLIAPWNAITTGAFKIGFNGVAPILYSTLNFSGATTMNAVAAIINTAIAAVGTCVWNAVYGRFDVTSLVTGVTSAVSYATAPGAGTDISGLLCLTAATGAQVPVPGQIAESLLSAVQALAVKSNDWYGLYNADVVTAVTADYIAVATFIEAATPSRMFGITTADQNTLIPGNTTNVAYQLNQAKYQRTFAQYSSLDAQAAVSEFGRFLTVDPTGTNTTITMKFKQEPGVLAETLTEDQASALIAINCNVFVNYNNSTAIVQNGTVASGFYIDEIWGTDWLQNYTQTNVFNLLYNSTTKIPQTDAGVSQIVTTVTAAMQQGVLNGLLAPGIWNGPNVGSLLTGQTLPMGFYVYAPPIALQTSAERAARKSPPIQVCVKLAGAIHSVNVIISVNR